MTQIGPYTVLDRLGAGGMGEVYRARDSRLGRDVAIKVLPPALANDADYLARFQREAQVLASLNHPNIAAIYGLEENAIVMELVEGAELRGPLPLDEAIRIARQIADALEAAHERGIIHRDLKPANIKITPDGTVKVLDFGLAKAQEQRTAAASAVNSPTLTIHATTAGVILGTAAYMSPEQAAGKAVDRRADVWAFGVVLWELVTGRQLFAGETVSHTLAAVLKDPIDLSPVPAGPVRTLIAHCLERDVRKRLAWIGDMRVILDTPAPAAVRQRRVWPWIAAAVACTLAAFAGGTMLRQSLSPSGALTMFTIAPPEKEHFHNAAVSPDGRRIALEVDRGGGQETTYLAIRSMDSLGLLKLQGTDDIHHAFWSPDGKSIAFFTNDKLRKIDLNGTVPASICDLPLADRIYVGSWHPN